MRSIRVMRLGCIVCLFILAFSHIGRSADTLGQKQWVDSVYFQMSLDQKIGQLMMVRAYSKSDNADVKKITELIENYHIGGICFFQGSPVRQVELINEYQKKSKVPLLISIDGEWGAGMRFPNNTISFPRQLTLGAIQDNTLIYEMGQEIARQCKKMGVHVNFAPVVDINSNPDNPVINDRSFGEDKYNVAAKAYAYMQGMQDENIISCAKHFPGHGDTGTDSHYSLPVITHNEARLRSVELFPFHALSNQGLASIMVGHLNIKAWMDDELKPTSLSKKITTDILKKEIGFEGLVFTDALDMAGVTNSYEPGIIELEAFKAGTDILLIPLDVKKAVDHIRSALNDGTISLQRLEESVKKILAAKYASGLSKAQELNTDKVLEFLNRNEALALKTRLIEKAITLVNDEQNLLPIGINETKNVLAISLGAETGNAFEFRMTSMGVINHLTFGKKILPEEKAAVLAEAKKFKKIIITLHDMSKSAKTNFGIDSSQLDLIHDLNLQSKVILCVMGSPYALKNFENISTLVEVYEDDDLFRDALAQALLGVSAMEGRLPVQASAKYYYNAGISKSGNGRMGYSIPERVGMSAAELAKIDLIAGKIISSSAAPGCQVIIAKDGRIVWDGAYGYTDYDRKTRVTSKTIYDVASLTKILATTLLVMDLQEKGVMNVNSPFDNYLPRLDTCNKSGIILKDAMSHVARLQPWIPFYESTLIKSGKQTYADTNIYTKTFSPQFSIPVAKRMFMREDYRDTIWSKILSSPLSPTDAYKYSDLGFIMLYKSIEIITGKRYENLVQDRIYEKLGLQRTLYKPIEKFPLEEIAPSERDDYWRHQVVHGTVHDMGAAMLGGVCGHAGLFSTAEEVAIIMQMLLNGGVYGGQRIFSEKTIAQFTHRHPKSTRRGLGFDMKELDPSKVMNMSTLASDRAFGHTGFTGTSTFADPVNNTVIVFLSNRTFPLSTNNKLAREDYRPRIQDIIYKAIKFHT